MGFSILPTLTSFLHYRISDLGSGSDWMMISLAPNRAGGACFFYIPAAHETWRENGMELLLCYWWCAARLVVIEWAKTVAKSSEEVDGNIICGGLYWRNWTIGEMRRPPSATLWNGGKKESDKKRGRHYQLAGYTQSKRKDVCNPLRK